MTWLRRYWLVLVLLGVSAFELVEGVAAVKADASARIVGGRFGAAVGLLIVTGTATILIWCYHRFFGSKPSK